MNLIAITGNLGRDCRTGDAGGTAVCNFTVAVKSGFGDKAQTLWIDCALFGKQASGALPDYLTKGQAVAVTGELGTKEHDGKTYLTCRVASVDLIGAKQDKTDTPAATRQPAAPDYDDDIPFN